MSSENQPNLSCNAPPRTPEQDAYAKWQYKKNILKYGNANAVIPTQKAFQRRAFSNIRTRRTCLSLSIYSSHILAVEPYYPPSVFNRRMPYSTRPYMENLKLANLTSKCKLLDGTGA